MYFETSIFRCCRLMESFKSTRFKHGYFVTKVILDMKDWIAVARERTGLPATAQEIVLPDKAARAFFFEVLKQEVSASLVMSRAQSV